MSEEANVAPGGAVDATPVAPAPSAPADNSALTAREAAAIIASRRQPDEQNTNAVEGKPPPAPNSPAQAEEDSARESDPAENAEHEADPVERPSIEPPRSWSKEDKELFATLPPETQQRIAEREAKREADFRRGQNETAESRKAIQAEKEQAERLRQQYEAALPALLNTLEQQNAGEFGDIKSWDDVQRMAEDDPFRFTKWQAHQARINDTKQKIQQAQTTRQQEQAKQYEAYADEQDRIFLERAPEFADQRSADKARRDAAEYLTKEIGFDPEDLAASWNGQKGISIRDAKLQIIIRDAMKWNAAQKAAKAAKPVNPVPAVQKPGVANTSPRMDEVKAAEARFSETLSARDAAALLAARRAAASRR